MSFFRATIDQAGIGLGKPPGKKDGGPEFPSVAKRQKTDEPDLGTRHPIAVNREMKLHG